MSTQVENLGAARSRQFHTSEFAEFQSAVSSSYVPLEVTSDYADRFVGGIRAVDLDQVHLSEVTARQHTVQRTRELIDRGDEVFFKLSVQLAGTGLLIQNNREAVLQPGDIAVYDTEQPYTLVFDDDFRMMVLMFPQTLLELPAGAIRQLAAVRLTAGSGVASVVAPFLTQLASGMDSLSGATGARLGRNALDLVATMFADELGVTRAHDALASRIRDYIEDHLGDADLSPAQIASAHFISTRHLHGIFSEQGETVAAWIRSRRLEHTHRDLLDPLLRNQLIAIVAARWGFLDAAHFSRLYKSAFGESPSETRARL